MTTGTTLMAASNEWANRPAEERFWTLDDVLADACLSKARSAEGTRQWENVDESLCVMPEGAEVGIGVNSTVQKPIRISPYAWRQLCSRHGAPASYLGTLRPELALECLRENLRVMTEDDNPETFVLATHDGNENAAERQWHLRDFAGSRFQRVWDQDVVELVAEITDGWVTPPAWAMSGEDDGSGLVRKATAADVSNHTLVREGDWITASGLYRSDRDMFLFRVDPQRTVVDDDSDGAGGLSAGVFVRNAEVSGVTTLRFTTFLFDFVCGNHIVWDAREISHYRRRHTGDALGDFEKAFRAALAKYNPAAALETIHAAQAAIPWKTGEDVVADLAGKRRLLSASLVEQAVAAADRQSEIHLDKFPPLSVWGIVSGLTAVSQQSAYASERALIDAVTPSILKLAS